MRSTPNPNLIKETEKWANILPFKPILVRPVHHIYSCFTINFDGHGPIHWLFPIYSNLSKLLVMITLKSKHVLFFITMKTIKGATYI